MRLWKEVRVAIWNRRNVVEREAKLRSALRHDFEEKGWRLQDDDHFASIAVDQSGERAGIAILEGDDAVSVLGVRDLSHRTQQFREASEEIRPFILTTEDVSPIDQQMANDNGIVIVQVPIEVADTSAGAPQAFDIVLEKISTATATAPDVEPQLSSEPEDGLSI